VAWFCEGSPVLLLNQQLTAFYGFDIWVVLKIFSTSLAQRNGVNPFTETGCENWNIWSSEDGQSIRLKRRHILRGATKRQALLDKLLAPQERPHQSDAPHR